MAGIDGDFDISEFKNLTSLTAGMVPGLMKAILDFKYLKEPFGKASGYHDSIYNKLIILICTAELEIFKMINGYLAEHCGTYLRNFKILKRNGVRVFSDLSDDYQLTFYRVD